MLLTTIKGFLCDCRIDWMRESIGIVIICYALSQVSCNFVVDFCICDSLS